MIQELSKEGIWQTKEQKGNTEVVRENQPGNQLLGAGIAPGDILIYRTADRVIRYQVALQDPERSSREVPLRPALGDSAPILLVEKLDNLLPYQIVDTSTEKARAKKVFSEFFKLELNGNEYQLKNIHTLGELLSVFQALERSGVAPSDVGMNGVANAHEPRGWGAAIDAVVKLSAAVKVSNEEFIQKYSSLFTRKAFIRATVLKVTGAVKHLDLTSGLPEEAKEVLRKQMEVSPDREAKKEVLINEKLQALREMVPGEIVQMMVKKPGKELKPLVLYKMTSDTFYDESEMFGRQILAKVYRLEQVDDWVRAQPESVDVVVSPELRKKETLKRKAVLALEEMPIGNLVVIDGVMYEKQVNGTFEEFSKRNTVIIGVDQPQIPIGALGEKIFLDPNFSELNILSRADSAVGRVQETDAEVERYYKNFLQLLPELYPKQAKGGIQEVLRYVGKESEIAQGGYGDCYLLAGLYAAKRADPELYVQTLARSISKRGSNWVVRFQGDTSGVGEIEVTPAEISEWKNGVGGRGGASADLPEIILERAYASFISRRRERVAGLTKRLSQDQRYAFEGGFGHRALADLFGYDVVEKQRIADYSGEDGKLPFSKQKNPENAREAKKLLREAFASGQKTSYIITANTPRERAGQKLNDDKYTYVEGQKIYFKHAHAVLGLEGNKVRLANPHDTSPKKQILLSMDAFLDTFSQLSLVKVNRKYKKFKEI